MNRFVIVEGLPYLYSNGKTYTVRWNEEGFTVGAEVSLASVPQKTFSEISILAKCAGCLDSIGAEPEEPEEPEEPKKPGRKKKTSAESGEVK